MQANSSYPAQVSVDYPEGPRNKLTVAFRIFTVIPIAIVAAAVGGGAFAGGPGPDGAAFASAGGALFFAPLLMIVFRQKYPRWWYDWNLALTRFSSRVGAYLALLTDQYPSTDEEQSVHIEIPYPDVPVELNRWLPLVKWFLAIPHYIVLFFLSIAALVITIVAWFAILFTGQYPRGMFGFVVGVGRWSTRVSAYAFLLTTDRYPPFSLDE
ncbi:MAG: DUF4389 domain-containing protein [Dehalococcoidia bacterium]